MKQISLILNLLKHHNILQLIFKDYLFRNRKVYKRLSDIPFTGVIKTPNGKDKFWTLTNYKNGLEHGLHQRFFLDGSLMETGIYKKGFREGEWKGYYPDGSIDYTLTKTYKVGKDINHYICKQFENRSHPLPQN